MTGSTTLRGRKILYLVSEDWYFCSHRLALGIAAKAAGAEVVVATRVDRHREEIERAGLRVAPIGMARGGTDPLHDLATIRELTRLYRDERPDLVHHVALKPILYGGLAAIRAEVPAVVNAVAGMGFIFISGGLLARSLRPIIRTAQRSLMNRSNTKTILQNPDDVAMYQNEVGVRPEQIAVIRGAGVDTDRFQPAPEPDGPLIAVCVSRMLWDKGIGELVAAAGLLKARGVDLKVRLVGPSDDNPASIARATLDGWSGDGLVEVAGPSDDIAGEYARAHIAVLPSYREGLPKSLLEAAAAGRPLVATDVPGCREVCREDESGLLVPARSIQPLADALERLAGDPALRRRLGENARRAAETEFSQELVIRQTLELYEEMLGR
ncbi:MAG: glycosyltransferase family 4 protein [Alphaproteobacteria bacterium]|nr:glycosyltransferase family 4 protein [Alphaproteobacteria bacterium]